MEWSFLKKNLAAGLFLAGLTLLLVACSPAGTSGEIDPENVVEAFVGDLAASATASGRLEPQRRVTLAADTPAAVAEVLVAEGEPVAAGDVLVRLETADLALSLAAAEQILVQRMADLAALENGATALELAAAEAEVAGARARLDDLLDGPSAAEITRAAASLQEAEASVLSASAGLLNTSDSVTQADVESARAALVAAEYQLAQAREINERFPIDRTDEQLRQAREAYDEAAARYQRLLNGVDTEDLAASQAELAAAAARRDGRQADLDELLQGGTADGIAAARSLLAQAESTLAALQEGTSDYQLRMAAAQVAQAELDVAEAQEALTAAEIVAPFAGVITGLHVAVGELASGPVVELVDLTTLELVLSVDEADLSAVAEGQTAALTLVSFPNETLSGTVRMIEPAAAAGASGVVSYDVYLALAETDLPVRVGMTADASLITAQRRDVLLVPNAAVRADRQTGKYYVNLAGSGTVVETEVAIGLRDSQNTEITSGLRSGDQLVIDYQPPIDTFAGPGGPFGGGQ